MHQKAYPLYVGVDILPKLGEIYQLYGYSRHAVLISDQKLKDRYGDFLCKEFEKKNIQINSIYMSEQHIEKGFQTIPFLVNQLLENKVESKDVLICMGGSRLLHLAGFVASVAFGGLPALFIPTTLTAQVVKTVDPVNRIAFDTVPDFFRTTGWPRLVWSDLSFLKTLPEQHFIAGLGHIFRHACLLKNGLFEFLENYVDELVKKDLDLLEELVQRSCDTRNALHKNHESDGNFFSRIHFGETATQTILNVVRPPVQYGEALFLGMLVEAVISYKKGIFSGTDFERFYELLKRFPLKYLLDRINGEKLLRKIEEKLKSQKHHRLTLPQAIGEFAVTSDVQFDEYEYAINIIFNE